eukprot:scaffold90877_cov19-Tisochrysis_lutea.AAC.1
MSAAFPHRQAPPGQHHPGGRSASPSHGPSHLQPAYPDRPLGSSSAICSEEALTRHRVSGLSKRLIVRKADGISYGHFLWT